jgi:hypothetical protein
MPRTDFRYEEFEGLLGSYYLTLLPLRNSQDLEDQKDFETALSILNGFAERHDIQKPEDAVAHPRETEQEWGKPKAFASCFSTIDMLSSFWRDFGVVDSSNTVENEEYRKFGCLLLRVFDRRKIIQAKFETNNGVSEAVGIKSWDSNKQFAPFE